MYHVYAYRVYNVGTIYVWMHVRGSLTDTRVLVYGSLTEPVCWYMALSLTHVSWYMALSLTHMSWYMALSLTQLFHLRICLGKIYVSMHMPLSLTHVPWCRGFALPWKRRSSLRWGLYKLMHGVYSIFVVPWRSYYDTYIHPYYKCEYT